MRIDVFQHRPAPGELPRWLQAAVVVACVITVAIAGAGGHAVWNAGGYEWASGRYVRFPQADKFWFENGLAIGIALVLCLTFVATNRVSRFVRMAVLVPFVHLIALAIAWRAFAPTAKLTTAFVNSLPVAPVLAVYAVASLMVAWVVARRARETADAFVVMTLVNLLMLGLWLPIIARLGIDEHKHYLGFVGPHYYSFSGFMHWVDSNLVLTRKLVGWVLVPPFVATVVVTVLVMRFPAWLARAKLGLFCTLGVVALAAMFCRGSGAHNASESTELYSNFTHVLLGLAALSIGALGLLGVVMWVRRSRKPRGRTIAGVIAADGGPVARIEITSWLRGPRGAVRSFTLVTDAGDVPVQGGRLVAALPLETTLLQTGEVVSLLRAGDRVQVAGFLDEDRGESPFRMMSVPVPGPHGLVVLPATAATTAATSAALAMWRPCIAYLAVLFIVALPALIGATAS